MLESQFQNKVMEYLKKKKGYFFKSIVSNKRGTPDIVGCYKGRFYAIECKGRYGKVSKYQAGAHQEITNNGGAMLVLQQRENYKEILEDFFTKELRSEK